MTLISRVMGLIRDVLIAHMLGAGSFADAFFVAFKVPNFLRRLFAEGAFSQAFVPVLSEYKVKGQQQVKALIGPVIGALGGVTFLVCLVAIFAAPVLTWLAAPGFAADPEKMLLTTEMMRITFPYLFFISLMAIASGVLNTYHIFGPSAFAPVILNASMITALLLQGLMPEQPVYLLAWAVLVAGFLQFLMHLPYLKAIGVLTWPQWNWQHPGVRKILRLMGPAVFGVSVSQINLLLDTILASFLVNGSVSWLYYSDRLIELPLGVFGIAIATVILPNLSTSHANEGKEAFRHTIDWGLRCVLALGLPAAVAMFILAEPILTTLFQYGLFNSEDVLKSAASLRAYTFGLVPFMLIKVLATGYFSRQDTRTPVKIGIFAMIVNMVANLALVWHFDHVGLALATSFSACVNAGLLYYGLVKQNVFHLSRLSILVCIRLCAASLVMGIGVWYLNDTQSQWFVWSIWQRCWHLLLLVSGGIVIYLASLFAFGARASQFSHRHG